MSKKPPRVVASVEARMSSSRLPGKMLADLGGVPSITRLLRRLRRCRSLDDIVLATTTSPADDQLEEWALDEGVKCFRGSEDDVLQRVVEAQRFAEGEVVVEITGDCILSDPDIIDMGVSVYLHNECDFVTNCEKHSFPPGLYVQVFSFSALNEVAMSIEDPSVREHVSLHFYEHPELYRTIHLMAPPMWHVPAETRLYLDYPEDLEFLRRLYAELEPIHGDEFGVTEIVEFLRENPSLIEINRNCRDKLVR